MPIISSPISIKDVEAEKMASRADGGRFEPILRKPPSFSAYSSCRVPARKERSGAPASDFTAQCFVTRSHPTVIVSRARSVNTLIRRYAEISGAPGQVNAAEALSFECLIVLILGFLGFHHVRFDPFTFTKPLNADEVNAWAALLFDEADALALDIFYSVTGFELWIVHAFIL